MSEKVTSIPKNEAELIELKKYISEHEGNLARKKMEVDSLYNYLTMFEELNHNFDDKNLSEFWSLYSFPPEIKNLVIEG